MSCEIDNNFGDNLANQFNSTQRFWPIESAGEFCYNLSQILLDDIICVPTLQDGRFKLIQDQRMKNLKSQMINPMLLPLREKQSMCSDQENSPTYSEVDQITATHVLHHLMVYLQYLKSDCQDLLTSNF